MSGLVIETQQCPAPQYLEVCHLFYVNHRSLSASTVEVTHHLGPILLVCLIYTV